MLSRFVGASLVLVLAGFVMADMTHNAVITKVDGGKITAMVRKKGEKKGEEKTFTVGKTAKITKGDDTVKSEELSDLVTKAAEGKGKMKGVFAKITTKDDSDEVVSIEIVQRKGKKKDKTDK